MAKKLNISPEDMIQTPVCKNTEEAISKEAFLKGFELCVKQFKGLNQAYFSGIIKRAQTDLGIITIEEYSDLMNLLEDNDFFAIALQVFYKAILFSRTAEESLGDINIDTLKNSLTLHIYKKVVKDNTQEVLLEERAVSGLLSNGEDISIFSKHGGYFIKYLKTGEVKEFSDILIKPEIREIGLIGVEVKGKGWIILNEKGEQVSPEGEFYLKIDLEYIKSLGILPVGVNGKGLILLDTNGKKVSPEGIYYLEFKSISLEGMYMLWANIRGKGWIILDQWRRQISEENTYYEGLSLTEIGLIKAEIKGKGEVLINKMGWQVTPKGEFYKNIKVYNLKDITLIEAEVIGEGKVLLGKNGVQISPKGEYYDGIDLHNLEKYGVIKVTKGEKNLLFDATWKQISPHEDRIYDGFDLWRFDEFGLIVGEIRLITKDIRRHGGILFDRDGKRISPEGEYFDSFDVSGLKEFGLIVGKSINKGCVLFDKTGKRLSPEGEIYEHFNTSKLEKTGIIVAGIKDKGAILININGKQITPKGEYFDWFNFDYFENIGLIKARKELENILLDKTGKKHFSSEKSIKFDEEKKQFYTEGLFGRKKYIEVNLDSNKL